MCRCLHSTRPFFLCVWGHEKRLNIFRVLQRDVRERNYPLASVCKEIILMLKNRSAKLMNDVKTDNTLDLFLREKHQVNLVKCSTIER